MSNLATVQPAAPIQPFFTDEQERMILSTFLGGASKSEATVLLEMVKRRRLDPFSRQVYFVKRWDNAKHAEAWAIQTSIDGLRSIAERTGKYDGQDEPEYGQDEGGKFCKVRVYRKDWSPTRAAVGIAYYDEFVQKKKDGGITSFWARMPRLMLAKCAEALAIRKAFPEDAAGLYISEEMPEERPTEAAKFVREVEAHIAKSLPPVPAPEDAKVLEPTPETDTEPEAEEEWSETAAMKARIAAATTLAQLIKLVPDIKKMPSSLAAEIRDGAYADRARELQESK